MRRTRVRSGRALGVALGVAVGLGVRKGVAVTAGVGDEDGGLTVAVAVGVAVAVAVAVGVGVGVGVKVPLHFPALPALKIAWISASLSARSIWIPGRLRSARARPPTHRAPAGATARPLLSSTASERQPERLHFPLCSKRETYGVVVESVP